MFKVQYYTKIISHLPKFIRTSVNKYLYRKFQCDFILEPEMFRGQRILIIGPARTVEDDLSTIDTAGYDSVVKLNNGLDTPINASGLRPLQCDILFHSLTPDTRPITPEMLKQARVRLLVHRTPKRSAFLHTLQASDRYSDVCSTKNIPCHLYDELSKMLDGAAPTTGLVCAYFFLNAPIREIAIAGYTFFSTSYIEGYNDAVTSDKVAASRIADMGHHAPKLEAHILAEMVKRAREKGKIVILGKSLVEAAGSFGVSCL